MEPITKKQIAKLWAMSRYYGIEEDLLYEAVKKVTGSDSISALSKQEGSRMIDFLNSFTDEHRPGMVTDRQLWQIEQLERALGWEGDPRRLKGFIKRITKVDNPKWLTPAAASKVIIGLTKIKKQEEKKALQQQG